MTKAGFARWSKTWKNWCEEFERQGKKERYYCTVTTFFVYMSLHYINLETTKITMIMIMLLYEEYAQRDEYDAWCELLFQQKTVSIHVICIFIYFYIVLVMTQLIQKTFFFLVHSLRALGSMEMRLHCGKDYTKNIKRPESYWLTLDQTKHLAMIRLAEATTQYS